MKVSFIHTGDLHLGRQFHFKRNGDVFGSNKRTDLWRTFDKILNTAEKNQIDLLLIAGDLFDSDEIEISEIDRAADKFSKLSMTKVVILAGNHDYYSSVALYGLVDWPDNVNILHSGRMESIYFPSLETEVFGLSWVKNAYSDIPFKGHLELEEDRNNIMMLHGDAYSRVSDFMPLNIADYDYFDYVALGHFHKYEMLTKRAGYCGSPEALHFGETGDHGVIVGQIENHRCHTQFIKIQEREYVTADVEITPDLSMDDILEKVIGIAGEQKRHRDFFRINLVGYCDTDLSLGWLSDELRSHFYYLELDGSQLEYDLDIDGILEDNKDNIIGRFIQEMRRFGDDPVAKKALYYGLEGVLKERGTK